MFACEAASKICTFTGSNSIIPEWKQKESLVRFVIEYGMITLQSRRVDKILSQYPYTWKERGIDVKNAIKDLKILTDLEKIFRSIIISKDDEELITYIGIETYGFIKFLLHIQKAIYIEKIKLFYELNPALDSKYHQFKMTYTADIEEKFSSARVNKKTKYLFHGTPSENIIPILASGLRNCSKNDDLRLNGAVYGEGIYLSDSAEYSLGYCRVEKGNIAMLVYEVLDNPSWFKTKNIYVINDESSLILRYIIVINNYEYQQDGYIFSKLTKIMQNGELQQVECRKEMDKAMVISKVYNRRLLIEYKQLMKKSTTELGFSIKLTEEDNLRVWTVFIPAEHISNGKLELQMQKLGIPGLELEISFPEGYPIEPPFPRVIYPRFQSLTGHITAGGSICMEAISRKGWVPTTNMESLITQIKFVLAEGDARIDESHSSQRYGMIEAKEAFQRAMATHGWA